MERFIIGFLAGGAVMAIETHYGKEQVTAEVWVDRSINAMLARKFLHALDQRALTPI